MTWLFPTRTPKKQSICRAFTRPRDGLPSPKDHAREHARPEVAVLARASSGVAGSARRGTSHPYPGQTWLPHWGFFKTRRRAVPSRAAALSARRAVEPEPLLEGRRPPCELSRRAARRARADPRAARERWTVARLGGERLMKRRDRQPSVLL